MIKRTITRIRRLISSPFGPRPGTPADFEQNVPSVLFFNPWDPELSEENEHLVDQQIAWLTKWKDTQLLIEGHCDDQGPREYNLELGRKRAWAVKNYMINHGIDESRLMTISYGSERPLIPGDSEEARRLSRRVKTLVNQGA